MINLKSPSSSFMPSRSHHKVDVSGQEDDMVEHSGMKCSFVVGQDFVSESCHKKVSSKET